MARKSFGVTAPCVSATIRSAVSRESHDPCVGIRAVPIGEAMVACVIADHYLRQRGQVGDSPAWPFAPPKR